jgi:hypothetical protein
LAIASVKINTTQKGKTSAESITMNVTIRDIIGGLSEAEYIRSKIYDLCDNSLVDSDKNQSKLPNLSKKEK